MTINKPNLRTHFAQQVTKNFATNPELWLVTGDLGYDVWDEIREKYTDRYINVGAAESILYGTGLGLALSGKTPLLYSITSFLLYRPFESIRNYVNYEQIPVKLIGSGRDKNYATEGFSHWSEEDRQVMKLFPNIICHWPNTTEEIDELLPEFLNDKRPHYLNLSRT